REEDAVFLEMATDEKGSGNPIPPTIDECQVGWRKFCWIGGNEAFAKCIICPQSVAKEQCVGGLNRSRAWSIREGGSQVLLFIDIVEQREPDAIKALDLARR